MVKKYSAKKKSPVPKPYLRSVALLDVPKSEREYPFNIPAVANLGTLQFHSDVTFFIGENGTGKSTLLEAIAVAMGFNEEGGSIDHMFANASTVSELSKHIDARKGIGKPVDGFFLRAESFYNFATYIAGTDSPLTRYGGDLHTKSHGESFLALLMNRFEGNGLYILDEPEAALSPTRQLSALALMHQLVQENSQFIIATHSPILMAFPNARIIRFDQEGWTEVEYEETEHYQVTKYFLNNYQRQLERLFAEEPEKEDDEVE